MAIESFGEVLRKSARGELRPFVLIADPDEVVAFHGIKKLAERGRILAQLSIANNADVSHAADYCIGFDMAFDEPPFTLGDDELVQYEHMDEIVYAHRLSREDVLHMILNLPDGVLGINLVVAD